LKTKQVIFLLPVTIIIIIIAKTILPTLLILTVALTHDVIGFKNLANLWTSENGKMLSTCKITKRHDSDSLRRNQSKITSRLLLFDKKPRMSTVADGVRQRETDISLGFSDCANICHQ